MEQLGKAEPGPWSPPTIVTGPAATFRLVWPDPGKVLAPDRLIVATDSLRFSGCYAGPPAIRAERKGTCRCRWRG